MVGGEKKRPTPRRWILLVALVLVVAFVLPPLINISRYQHRIADSISRSIGRQVHISSVKLRLLPLPGFEFSDFSVEENPAFGAEPILHSGSVVAYLRLLSLWRGRLEVSRIHFDDASLNLVRKPDGALELRFDLGPGSAHPKRPHRTTLCRQRPAFSLYRGGKLAHQFQTRQRKETAIVPESDLSISLAPGDQWEVHFALNRCAPISISILPTRGCCELMAHCIGPRGSVRCR